MSIRSTLIAAAAVLLHGGISLQAAPSSLPLATSGEVRVPVVLVSFQDVDFTLEDPVEAFNAFFNGSSSVGRYYRDNSLGRFTPVFDILGPVKLERNIAWYGGNVFSGESDRAPEQVLTDAFTLLDGSVDFSLYDKDLDSFADLAVYVFAGYDEANFGPAESIWAHQGLVSESRSKTTQETTLDGIKFDKYFCVSELSGSSGESIAGIGPACHELGHALGLPDFYDTNSTFDGLCGGMYEYSLMCMGLYNDSSKTPPYLCALERKLLGWFLDIPELPEGEVQFSPVQECFAYRVDTSNPGEYFVCEMRNGTLWDAPLEKGIIVYHVDESRTKPLDWKLTPLELWNWRETSNCLNARASHPCAYIVPSSDKRSVNVSGGSGACVFPGNSGVHFLDLVAWDGSLVGVKLTDIGPNNLFVIKGHGAGIGGRVVAQKDSSPISGATVKADISSEPSVTDASGRFFIPLEGDFFDDPFSVSVIANGYRTLDRDGILEGESIDMLLELNASGEASSTELLKYDTGAEKIFYPFPERNFGDCIGAVRFTPGELFLHSGKLIEKISFDLYVSGGGASAVYVTVDFGEERVLTRKIEEPNIGILAHNEADISDAGLRIPEGTDVYIGYGVQGAENAYPLAATLTGHDGTSFYSSFDAEMSSWKPMYSSRSKTGYMDLIASATVTEVLGGDTCEKMGYSSIDISDGKCTFSGGNLAPLNIYWYLDGRLLEGEIVLEEIDPGEHVAEARVIYSGNRSETLKRIIIIDR